MHPLKLIAAISLYQLIVIFAQHSAQAFWLTDGSLFQQPTSRSSSSSSSTSVVVVGNQPDTSNEAKSLQKQQQQQQPQVVQEDSLVTIASSSRSEAVPSNENNITQTAIDIATANALLLANGGAIVTNRIEPWIRLTDTPSRSNTDDNGNINNSAQTSSTTSGQKGQNVGAANNQVCQCSSDWLQNQTSLWLSKWMNSIDFANHLKHSIVSMSNVSSSSPAVVHHRVGQTSGNTRSLAWNNRPSKRNGNVSSGAGGSSSSSSNNNNNNKSSQTHRPSPAQLRRHTSGHVNNLVGDNNSNNKDNLLSQQPASIKLIQGNQGPKGERGPQGERGPSALISVKDRDALFDLGPPPIGSGQKQAIETLTKSPLDQNQSVAPSLSDKQQQQQQQPSSNGRLAFVESEQMLVIETSLGWRPVPMLAPLKDFRKTIAKFTLNSAEDRRRLIMSDASLQLDSSQQLQTGAGPAGAGQLGASRKSAPAYLSDSPMLLINNSDNNYLNNILNAIENENSMGSINVEDSDDDDDDDDDDNDTDKRLNGDDGDDDDDDVDEEDDEEDDGDDDGDDEEDERNEIGDGDDQDDDDGAGSALPANKMKHDDVSGGAVKSRNGVGSRKMAANRGTGLVRSDGHAKAKRRRAQVAAGGRSSLSASAGASDAAETNSISLEPPAPSPVSRQLAAGRSQASDDKQVARGEPSETSSRSATLTGQSSQSSQNGAMKLRLVALNEPFAGNQHGLRGANFECKRNAARANVKGAFRALLATNYQNLNEIVRYNSHVQKFPIVNLRGETLAGSWYDLFKSPARMTNPLSRIYSFDGRHVATDPNWPNKLVWHGAGNKFGQRDLAHNCDGWHSDSLSKFGFASPLHSPKGHQHNLHHHQQQHQSAKRTNQHRQRFVNVESSPSSSSSVPLSLQASSRRDEADQQQQTIAQNTTLGGRNRSYPAPLPLVFDTIEKYPCRMPLIVLCIETIAQAD